MLEQRAGGKTLAVSRRYASDLTAAIKTGTYSADAADWLAGVDINNPVNSTIGWASEANAFVCSTVLDQGLQYIEGTDLATDYYNAAVPVFELQLAKAGYRLAAWLNLVATGSTGLL
jgi:S1/P1 Nuclease